MNRKCYVFISVNRFEYLGLVRVLIYCPVPDMPAAICDRERVYRISGILHKKGGEIMTKEKTVIKVRRGLNGFRYSACDAQGNFLGNFAKLADVRRHWLREIKWGKLY